jgi:hypothetical protein
MAAGPAKQGVLRTRAEEGDDGAGIQEVMVFLRGVKLQMNRVQESIESYTARVDHLERALLESTVVARPPQRHPTRTNAPDVDCTAMLDDLGDWDNGALLRHLYLHNENAYAADEDGVDPTHCRAVILSDDIHALNENCVGKWTGARSGSLATLFLGGPAGDAEFRRVSLIPRCVALHIPFVTMQIDAGADNRRIWGQELGWLQSDRVLAYAFHMGYACEDTLYTPMAELLWLIGARHPHVYSFEFPVDIGQAVQCFSNEEGSKNLCGNTLDTCTSRQRAKEAYALVQTVAEKYASEFSTPRTYRFMAAGADSFEDHFMPRFPAVSAEGPRSGANSIVRADAAIGWAREVLDMECTTDLGYLLCLVFVSSVVKSCGGTAIETQDAIFESKIDMRRLRTEICNVQMMVRGWEHDEELDTAHVRLMTKLVDILLM